MPDADRVNIRLAAVNNGGGRFYTYKLGYVREGNQAVCIACRIGYKLDDVFWDYVGACAPINLKSGIAGNHLVIKRSRLEKGKRFF